MIELGVMLEGQEGLNWERWRRICNDAERLGFASLRRSDHLISLMGPNTGDRDCIECWTSLALAAEWTRRIEIGPMVSPMTFRLPAVLAKIAASVDSLSGGRLILGVGAGWNENEHKVFGIPFLTQKERFDLLERGVPTMLDIWKTTNPRPEWNLSRLDADMFRDRSEYLDRCCHDAGRDPSTVKRSLMTSYIIGRTRDEQLDRAAKVREVVPDLRAMSPEEVLLSRKDAWLVGTPEEIAERIRELGRLGVQLFMLQHFLLDDSEGLELLAREVLPAVA